MTAFGSRTQAKTQKAADNLTRVKERHGGVTQALVRRESLERRFVLYEFLGVLLGRTELWVSVTELYTPAKP